MTRRAPLAILFLFHLFVPSALSAETTISSKQLEFFEQHIRPASAEHCYSCHNSFDKQKGDIVLDHRAPMVEADLIVAGDPDKSLLIQVIRHDEDVAHMPEGAPQLERSVIQRFEQWVRMGAPDPRSTKPIQQDQPVELDWEHVRDQRAEWWSFQPIVNHEPPVVADDQWNQTTIDRFLFSKMQASDLQPQPVARPNTLLRRLSLVLTGLPPSAPDVEAFTSNPSRSAYESFVDKYLSSEAFAQRWARHWLDWFRYAESHGSEGDPAIPYASQYRDYVIRALHQDVPYDQLIREHIAGDLLESPRIHDELGINESAIGLAHYRMVPHGFGVTDAYQEQITFTDNQVDVVTKAILGLTVSCARCHNHKFDPISQEDFYKLYGIMISSRPAVLNVDSPELQAKNRSELAELKSTIRDEIAQHWLQHVDDSIEQMSLHEGRRKQGSSKATSKRARNADSENHLNSLDAWFKLCEQTGESFEHARDRMIQQFNQRAEENRHRIKQATFYADLRDSDTFATWFRNGAGLNQPGVDLDAIHTGPSPPGCFSVAASGDNALTGIYPAGVYSHLISDKDNANLASVLHEAKGQHAACRMVGRDAVARMPIRNYPVVHGGLHPSVKMPTSMSWQAMRKYKYWNGEQVYFQFSTAADTPTHVGSERSWFGVTEVYAGDTPLHELGYSAVTLPGNLSTVKDRHSLVAFYRTQLVESLNAWSTGSISDSQSQLVEAFRQRGWLNDRLDDLPSEVVDLIEKYRTLENEIRAPVRAPGVVEGQPWDQPLLVRGDQRTESDPVQRGILEVLGNEAYSGNSSGRAELAESLVGTTTKNPLTPRVIVNRLWHHVFGRGLVATTDNFGRLGKQPTHPELLDHLAITFQEDGWSIKNFVRRLALSRAFQSASNASDFATQNDPNNEMLSHFTPRRLEAEVIYDTVQSLAGRMSQRAIALRVRRNSIHPFLATFNFPVPVSTVGVRDSTNVPAQALTLLNGDLALDAANDWASRIRADSKHASESDIVRLFAEAFSRTPSEEELQACREFLATPTDESGIEALQQQHDVALDTVRRLSTDRKKLLEPKRKELQAVRDADSKSQPSGSTISPVAAWNFSKSLDDQVGALRTELKGDASQTGGSLRLQGGYAGTSPLPFDLAERTLDVIVQLESLDQRGGGAMTIQTLDGHVFDSIVWSESVVRQWIGGSDQFRRTLPFEGPRDEQAAEKVVRMTMVFQADGTRIAYRNGQPYGKPVRKAPLQSFQPREAQILFGLRHGTSPVPGRSLRGTIFAASLYDRALSPDEVLASSPDGFENIVSDADVFRSLDQPTRNRVEELSKRLKAAEQDAAEIGVRLQQLRKASKRLPSPLSRLAHAILNSKELIYVH